MVHIKLPCAPRSAGHTSHNEAANKRSLSKVLKINWTHCKLRTSLFWFNANLVSPRTVWLWLETVFVQLSICNPFLFHPIYLVRIGSRFSTFLLFVSNANCHRVVAWNVILSSPVIYTLHKPANKKSPNIFGAWTGLCKNELKSEWCMWWAWINRTRQKARKYENLGHRIGAKWRHEAVNRKSGGLRSCMFYTGMRMLETLLEYAKEQGLCTSKIKQVWKKQSN